MQSSRQNACRGLSIPCQYYIGRDKNYDTSCQLCKHLVSPHLLTPSEDMVHILATCRATSDTRERILPDLLNAISIHMPTNPILELQNSEQLTQLVLDPTSLNLPLNVRVSPDHPFLPTILPMCRNYCFTIHKHRSRLLKEIKL